MNKQLTPEALLTRRFKIIAPDTSCRFKPGEILYEYKFLSGSSCYVFHRDILYGQRFKKKHVEGMPHLFRELEWWEDRPEKERPVFVRSFVAGKTHYHHVDGINIIWSKSGGWMEYTNGGGILSHYLLPATEEEYNAYRNSLMIKDQANGQ